MEANNLPSVPQPCPHCGGQQPWFPDQEKITELEGQAAVLASKTTSASTSSPHIVVQP